jgi:hypothetical protein
VLPAEEQDDQREHTEDESDEYDVHTVEVAEQADDKQLDTAEPALAVQKAPGDGHADDVEKADDKHECYGADQ